MGAIVGAGAGFGWALPRERRGPCPPPERFESSARGPAFPATLRVTRSLRPTKNPPCGGSFVWNWQPRMDSNHRMPESESGALPLGDGAMGPSLTPERAPANTLD